VDWIVAPGAAGIRAAAGWDARDPPVWPAIDESLALDVTRRVVWLRLLADTVPFAPAAASLALLGAVALGWSGTDRYAPGLSAWTRALRAVRPHLEGRS